MKYDPRFDVPTVLSFDEIDAAVARGRRLRAEAMRSAADHAAVGAARLFRKPAPAAV